MVSRREREKSSRSFPEVIRVASRHIQIRGGSGSGAGEEKERAVDEKSFDGMKRKTRVAANEEEEEKQSEKQVKTRQDESA